MFYSLYDAFKVVSILFKTSCPGCWTRVVCTTSTSAHIELATSMNNYFVDTHAFMTVYKVYTYVLKGAKVEETSIG